VQPLDQGLRAALDLHLRQQHQAHHGRDGQRDHHRREHRQTVRDRERPEERRGHPAHEQHGDQHHGVDQRRVDDGLSHLERGLENDPADRLADHALAAVLPQPSHDVLDVDDRVIDDDADGDDEPGEDHGVDGRAPHLEHDDAAMSESGIATRLMSAVRHSNRNAAKHDHHQQAAEQQRPR
jgi:hypothetical protein